jgi:hypothetical protein
MAKRTEEEARLRLIAGREAHQEFGRLAERYWKLRETMTPEAITAIWFLLGDKMFLHDEGEV